MQRAAQKGHMSPDRLSAGKAADGLIDHSLKDRGGKVLLRSALVDEGLDISLGEHTAAGRYGVEGVIVFGILIQPCRIGLQKGGHLVDERACTTGADAVHALLNVAALKIDDLGVLAAQLYGYVRDGCEGLQRGRYGDHLLDKRNLQMVGQREAAGAGDHGMYREVPEGFMGLFKKTGEGLLDIGKMSLVVGKEYLMPAV